MTATPMPATYLPVWVAFSFVVAAAGAFVALTAISQVRTPAEGRSRWMNIAAAAIALGGIGIWSMHFIGMLALRLNMGVSYALPETVASLVAAVAACAVALHWVARRQSLVRIAAAGTLLGLAVVVMHYLGMVGMRFNGYIQWSLGMAALSVLIAVVAAIAGLWLAFNAHGVTTRGVASVIIAAAVCAMHYTGMQAADFFCTSPNPGAFPTGPWLVYSLDLPGLVTGTAIGMAILLAMDQFLQRAARGTIGSARHTS